MECKKCGAGEEEKKMEACPTCRKNVCNDCLYTMQGKGFCSDGCAMWFFHGEGDDESDFEENPDET